MNRMILMVFLLVLPTLSSASGIFVGWNGIETNPVDPGCDNVTDVAEFMIGFYLSESLEDVIEIEATLDFCTAPRTLPPWWGGDGAASCTQPLLSASADFASYPIYNVDLWEGAATAVLQYQPNFEESPVRARAVLTASVDPGFARDLTAGTRYYAVKFVIDGRGSDCAGCELEACFMVNGITVRGLGGWTRFYGPYMDASAGWNIFGLGCPYIVGTESLSFGTIKVRFGE